MAGPRLQILSEIFFYGCSSEKGGDPSQSLHAYTAVILWVSRFTGKHEGHICTTSEGDETGNATLFARGTTNGGSSSSNFE